MKPEDLQTNPEIEISILRILPDAVLIADGQ